MASQTCDVTKIQDEDVLRRMWQETEDFSKKKEIRAHMYKVREQRLKDFYTTGEVARDIQTTSTITSKSSNTKQAENTHHADSLLDHSFQSLKSKEIRDSTSPTKELTSFSRSAARQDNGWNIKESQESSQDGKKQTMSRVATTSGSKDIQGGVANYAAKNEATASVFQDGDDKNFKKAVGASNTSVLKQEAHGVDGNATFHSSSTSSKSSSHYSSEQKSTLPTETKTTRTTRGYVPDEVLKDPNTKVFTETKTLPDGTKVTTTRYETTGGHQNISSSSRTDSSTTMKRSEQQQREQREQREERVKQHVEHVQTKQLQEHRDQQHVQETDKQHRHVQESKTQNVSENLQKSNVNVEVRKEHHEEHQQRSSEVQKQDQRTQEVRQEVRQVCDNVEKVPKKSEKVETVITVATKTINERPTEQQSETRRTSVQTDHRDASLNKVSTNVENVEKVQHSTSTTSTEKHQKNVSSNVTSNVTSTMNIFDNKRVSIDISATHDAFARSLRSVTPERERNKKTYRLSPDRKGSQQFASNETITKSVHSSVRKTEYDSRRNSTKSRSRSPSEDIDRTSRFSITGKVTERSPTSPTKKSPTITRRPSDECRPTGKNEKVLRRTDTYEERVRQILGIAEKKKPKPETNVSDIIRSDRNANRKPSLPDVARRTPSKSPEKKVQEYPAQKRKSSEPDRRPSLKPSPEKDIMPQTSWLPSAPRQTPERRTPDRKTPDRVTFSATATAKEIRKYHDGKRTCSPAINLEIVTVTDDKLGNRKSPPGDKDEIITKAFMSAKNGHVYTVDFINVEKEMTSKERKSPPRSSPQRDNPERTSSPRVTPQRDTPDRASPQREALTQEQIKEDVMLATKRKSLTKQNSEDTLIEETTKYIKGKEIEVDEPLFTKKFMYKLGEDEEVPLAPKSKSPVHTLEDEIIVDVKETTTKQKSVKKDLSRDVEKQTKKKVVLEEVTVIPVTPKKTPKKPSSKDLPEEKRTTTTTVTATINLEPVSSTPVTPTSTKTPKPKNAGNKNSRPKQRPDVVAETPKCISTKSIIINEAVAEQREIIVDLKQLKRSKSSREDSPEKVWPIQTEEDSGIPRYPDQIQEPEESRTRKLKKVNEITIDENEHLEEFNRITELIDTEITDVDRVAETDECLLTVNEKVNKFQNVRETQGGPRRPKGPAPKVNRPEFTVDETLESDECLLSVSDKVNKFKTTADKLTVDVERPERPKSPRCQFSTEENKTQETVTVIKNQERVTREDLKDDECLQSVSEKVIKFVDTADTLKSKPSTVKPKVKTPAATVQAPDETPKSSKKVYLSAVGKLRSTDSIKKARELFESAKSETTSKPRTKQDVTTKRMDSFTRPTTVTSKDVKLEDIGIESTEIHSDKTHLEKVRRTLTYEDDSNVPGYMKQLDRTLRITSPHRESVMELEAISKGHDENVKTTKFGVTLRRTDSGVKNSTFTTTDRKEVATIDINGTKKEVEDVYDLEILETMLESVTSYEIRRRIRSQIRIVKKMISEGQITVTNGYGQPGKPKARVSPEKVSSVTERHQTTSRRITTSRGTDEVLRSETRNNRRSPDKVDFKPFRRTPERQLESKVRKDDRPDWAKERPLRKASERVLPSTKKTTSATTTTVRKNTETRRERTPSKDATDAITSCYGIGPTDENGMPLFGLKALRAANKTKVQGQITKSTYYSENGQEPVGEVKVTKYSSDAKDLGAGTLQSHGNGILSKTITQKIGKKPITTYSKTVTDKKNDERTTKVTRRNSVKEITQKFIDNTIESSNSERNKNTYKAGLILRTSSFKDRRGSKSTSRETTPETITITKKTSGGSFLTNTSKVTGMQDVITRMKTEEHVEGDSREDAEARQLLNKFLGSQVILAGMEGTSGTRTSSSSNLQSRNVKSSSASASTTQSANKRTTKVTTTVTENGVPKTNTRSYTHPITQEVLDTVWDEQTLRLLLEQSTEYEERRVIRARLKQVMAEKEACSEFMEKTLEEAQTGNVHGESLLLPLLQNALLPPEFEQTADSGTESGEDLRSGLILEVQNALEKLSACLCNDSSDISQERRNSLLQLVSKLQTNLVTPAQPRDDTDGNDSINVSQERRLSGGRFARRQRQRHTRHTVGVTSEELEDARRLMEEFVLSSSQDNVPALHEKLEDKPGYGPVKVNQGVKNAMPKPFANSANTSGSSSTVQTPSNESIEMDRPLEFPLSLDDVNMNSERYCYKQSMSLDQPEESRPKLLHAAFSLDCDQNAELISAVQQAAILKSKPEISEIETDDETLRHDKQVLPISPICQPQLKDGDTVVLYDQGIYPPPPPSQTASAQTYEEPVVLQANPLYSQEAEKSNRFNAKKSRMKRANTIDIPKSAKYYYDDHDSDGDLTEPETSRRSNYLALRGPIRVGNQNSVSNKVPSFEPKTESDKKFLAFINKQNASAGVSNKISLWDKASQKAENSGTNWTRKFGNIKTNFERVTNTTQSSTNSTPEPQKNSARNFWKSNENQTIKHAAKSLRERFEPETTATPNNKHIIAGSLKFEPPNKNFKIVPQQLPVNKFTHNPHESAFKPIQKTPKPDVMAHIKSNGSESSTPETPLFLYSPKSFEVQSPVHNSVPWNNNKSSGQTTPGMGERRVLTLAASKFEAANTTDESKFVPRKLSKEKVTVPSSLLQNNKPEKLVAYVPPVTKAGGVRKLSGQYDNMDTQRAEYIAQSNVKYKSAFAPVPQTRNAQNYANAANNVNTHTEHKFNHALVSSPSEKYDKYIASHAHFNHDHNAPKIEAIPPSFHTTSSQVQNIQMRQADSHYQHHPSQGNVYYNNVQVQERKHSSPVITNDYDHLNYQQFQQPQQTRALNNVQQNNLNHNHEQTDQQNVYYNNVTYQAPTPNVNTQPNQTTRPHYDSQTSTESVHEYVAVSSKVMSGPVSQQAVTVTNKPKSRTEHDLDAAFNLRNTLQIKSDIKSKSPTGSSGYQPKFCVNDKPLSLDKLEVNSRGESIVTGKFQIPVQPPPPQQLKPSIPQQRVSPQLSKSDSWHQVVQKEQFARKPSPHASPNARTVIKSKSTHALALPKQFEAGMSKDEMQVKKRTMEAYFGQSQIEQQQMNQFQARGSSASHKRSVNRTKTTQKISTSTTEKIVTTKTFNEGPMSRTQVTTKVTSQQQIVKKPMSPFAKFRQMDRQNSLNTPPSTPKTPTSGGPMFKFTDPNLNQSASTIKERLLHWCQMKTREYDNIKLDNFSTCWADGLAFCALVHHFLPDAFDYSKLTPNNRRYNFTLAFQVADEKADIAPLLDVDDMVAIRRPDWKCVFTYVQSIYRRFKDQD